MKYLSKRDDFLRKTKINDSDDFLRSAKSGLQPYELIKEDGGPFYNTVGWNDSLLGRLVNHMIRKAKVTIGKARIKPVIKSLYSEFDAIKAEGVLIEAGDETIVEYNRILLSESIAQLSKSIEENEPKEEILGLTKLTIETLQNMEVEKKDIINKEVEDFKNFLESLKDENNKEEEIDEPESEKKDMSSLYPEMIKNLKSISQILKAGEITIKNNNNKEVEELDDLRDALKQAEKNPKTNKVQIDILKRTIQNKEAKLKPNSLVTTERYSLLESITTDELIEKIEDSIDYLRSKDKVTIDNNLIDGILSQSDQYKKSVIKLYTEVHSFLVGRKSKTLNYEPKLEGVNLIENKGVDQIAEKIAKFSKNMLLFDNNEILNNIGEEGQYIKSFIETIKKIKSFNNEVVDNVEKQNSNRLLKFDNFLKLNELVESDVNNDEKTEEPSDIPTGSRSEKIQDFFDRKCKTTKDYVIDKTEAEKIRDNFEKLGESNENFVIDGFDPIINIIRLFNRAYKIFTVTTITKRRNGTVDPSTFSEYTSYGGRTGTGELNGWAGPFRNNKIFNIWEDEILKILGDSNYQYIFNKKTKLRIPKVPNPTKAEDYEYREGAGLQLKRFMNDILDGQELYKISSSGNTNSKGTQAKFLEKYFGDPDEKTKEELGKDTSFTLDKEDGDENSKNAEKIKDGSIKLKFSKVKNKNLEKNQFFVVQCNTIDDEGAVDPKPKYRFFKISEMKKTGAIYLSLCNSFYFFNGYLKDAPNKDDKDGRNKLIEKGDLDRLTLESRFPSNRGFKTYVVKYVNAKAPEINKLLTPGSEIELNVARSDKSIEKEKIKVLGGYWLTDEKNEVYTANLTNEHLDKKITGGSNKIKDVQAFLNNVNNTSIK